MKSLFQLRSNRPTHPFIHFFLSVERANSIGIQNIEIDIRCYRCSCLFQLPYLFRLEIISRNHSSPAPFLLPHSTHPAARSTIASITIDHANQLSSSFHLLSASLQSFLSLLLYPPLVQPPSGLRRACLTLTASSCNQAMFTGARRRMPRGNGLEQRTRNHRHMSTECHSYCGKKTHLYSANRLRVQRKFRAICFSLFLFILLICQLDSFFIHLSFLSVSI